MKLLIPKYWKIIKIKKDRNLNNEKIFIFKLISNNKYLKSYNFWRNFLDFLITKELERTTNFQKQNINYILLTHLLTNVNNMIGFNLNIRIIIKIIDEISEIYNYLNEDSYNTIFTLLGCNKEQIEMYRKEIKENNNLKNQIIFYIYLMNNNKYINIFFWLNYNNFKLNNNKASKSDNNGNPKSDNKKTSNCDNNNERKIYLNNYLNY